MRPMKLIGYARVSTRDQTAAPQREALRLDLDLFFDVFAEDIVPSGVAELSHLQMQGYTYIKP